MIRHGVIMVLAGAAALLPGSLSAQQADSGAFFVRLGKDTLAVERYVRTPRQQVSDAVLRTPQTRALRLTLTFNADGTVSSYEVLNSPVAGVPNSSGVVRTLVTYRGDSAQVETWVAGAARPPRRIGARGDMLPVQLPFYSMYELALSRARKAAPDSVDMSMLSGSGPLIYGVRWLPGDSVTLFHPASGHIRGLMDSNGRLLGLNAENTTFKVVVSRARSADIAAFAKRFAALDAQGRSVGTLSPRDTIAAVAAGSSILIDYSRPSKRGRVIFGSVVPWGQVWRSGANAATQLTLGDSVEINGVKVPPGKYTLWTIPDQQQWQLILNKQTGQWGTNYDQKQDLVRIPVRTERVPVPVEQFTIDVQQKSNRAALLTLTWDRTRVLVPLKSVVTR